MKKIILLFAISLISFNSKSMVTDTIVADSSVIAQRSIGVDSLTGLEQRVVVWQLTIDTKAQMVVIVYRIETLAPNGKVVSVSDNKTYTRFNEPGNMAFNNLHNSEVGKTIAGMIAINLLSYPNMQQ